MKCSVRLYKERKGLLDNQGRTEKPTTVIGGEPVESREEKSKGTPGFGKFWRQNEMSKRLNDFKKSEKLYHESGKPPPIPFSFSHTSLAYLQRNPWKFRTKRNDVGWERSVAENRRSHFIKMVGSSELKWKRQNFMRSREWERICFITIKTSTTPTPCYFCQNWICPIYPRLIYSGTCDLFQLPASDDLTFSTRDTENLLEPGRKFIRRSSRGHPN